MMLRIHLAAALALCGLLASGLWAGTPCVALFVDGSVTVKPANAAQRELAIGDRLNTGDSLKTGADGSAELEQAGVVIKISPRTVFSLSEREIGGKRQDVVAVAVGSMKLKYDKLSGKEPMIRTASCAAGVRGTELAVFAGEDGASLFVVESGLVDISAAGSTVSLQKGNAVEVRPGQAPGPIFQIPAAIDYEAWNGERLAAMLGDPLAAMDELDHLLQAYARDSADYHRRYQDANAELASERQKLLAIRAEQGEDAFNRYRDATVTPLGYRTANLVLNLRYHALGALDLRRYVVGRLYLALKPLSLGGDPAWPRFLPRYEAFLERFDREIMPHLVDADLY